MNPRKFMQCDIVRAKSDRERMTVDFYVDSLVQCMWYDKWFRFYEADFPDDSLELIRRKWVTEDGRGEAPPSVKLRELSMKRVRVRSVFVGLTAWTI